MKKKNTKPERIKARKAATENFIQTINNCPLQSELKSNLIQAFYRTIERIHKDVDPETELFRPGLTEAPQFINPRDPRYRYKEHDEIVLGLRSFNIFSEDFYAMLRVKWKAMLITFDPYYFDLEYNKK
jgi:hypothetical protein